MNKIKKGNKGNRYLNNILETLGEEYISNDEDIISNGEKSFNLEHKVCGNSFQLSWKQVSEGSKCPFCYRHGRKISKDYFENYISEKYNQEFVFVDEEVRRKKHRFFLIKHISCGNDFWISQIFFEKRRPLCPCCERGMTTEIFKERLKDKYNDEYTVLGEYQGLNTPIKLRHNICGSVIDTIRPNNILYMGQGCKKCGMKKAGNNMKKKRAPKFYKDLKDKFGDRFILYTEYNGYHEKITYFDTLTDRVCSNKPSDILKKSLIPSKSKGEIRIANYLESNMIIFEEQKIYPDLKDKSNLRFDFFIPDRNLLIEFDGSQHFKPRKDDPDGEKFKILQIHDNMKDQYCKINNINLLRIPYFEFGKIEEILQNYLNL